MQLSAARRDSRAKLKATAKDAAVAKPPDRGRFVISFVDDMHLAYAMEIPLQEMRAGQYVLQVTAIDRIAQASTSQRVRFEVQ